MSSYGQGPRLHALCSGKKTKQNKRQKKRGCPVKDGVRTNNEDEVMAWGDVGHESPSGGGAAETKAGHGTTADRGKEFMTGGEARGTVCEHGGGVEREGKEGP